MCSVRTSGSAGPSLTTEADELALFHRTLAELCRADVPLPRAFRALQEDLRRGRFRDAVRDMADEVESGVSLGEAYARRTREFPPLYRALVEAGMVSGDLPAVLEEISRHAARRARAAARIRKALAYPLVTAGFVLVIGIGLLVFVLPTLWALPAELAILEADLSSPVPVAGGALAVLAGLAMGALLFAWWRGPLDGARRLPVLGRLRLLAAKSSVSATLALLVRRGVPLPTTLALAAEAADDAGLRAKLQEMAASARGGAGLQELLRHHALFEPTLLWLIEAAGRSGDLPRALEEVADLHESRLERGVDRLTTLLMPVAEIVVGAAVFVLVYSFVVPLWEIQAQLLGH